VQVFVPGPVGVQSAWLLQLPLLVRQLSMGTQLAPLPE
jgi:hypothetical protein